VLRRPETDSPAATPEAATKPDTSQGRTPDTWLVPLGLLALCLLAYGLLIPRLGYYFDDWLLVWRHLKLGVGSLVQLDAGIRPFLGDTHAAVARLVGNHPLPWHLLALAMRWLASVALWWVLRSVWPRSRSDVFAVAALFAVYPGFSLQPVARIFWLPHAQLGLLFISWGLSTRALRKHGRSGLLALGGVLTFIPTLVTEYYVGLELVRPLLLWLILGDRAISPKERRRNVLLAWLPYVAILAAFACWRLAFAGPGVGYMDSSAITAAFLANPLRELALRVYVFFNNLLSAGVLSWVQTLFWNQVPGGPLTSGTGSIAARLVGICVGLAGAGVVLAVARLVSRREPPDGPAARADDGWGREAVLAGILALCAGALPYVIPNLSITLHAADDRFILPMMLGACLLVAGSARVLLGSRRRLGFAAAAIAALAVGFHSINSRIYADQWAKTRSLIWQFCWRVPAVEEKAAFLKDMPPGTTIVVPEYHNTWSLALDLPYPRTSDRGFSGLSLRVFPIGSYYRRTGLWPDTPLRYEQSQGGPFTSSVARSAVMWTSPSGCLWLLDSLRDETPEADPFTRAAQPLSHLDAVVLRDTGTRAPRPPSEVFGPEPAHRWYYYFQKVCLARQFGEWQQALALADSARGRSLTPKDPCEWLPFIETYLVTGRFEDARLLVTKVARARSDARSALIQLLERVRTSPAAAADPGRNLQDLREAMDHAPGER